MEALENYSLVKDGNISVDRFHAFLEVFLYVAFLSPAQLRVVSSIPFAPEDLLVRYGSKIVKKLREVSKLLPSVCGPTAQVAPLQTDTLLPVPLAPVQASHILRPFICTYCSKSSYKVTHCF